MSMFRGLIGSRLCLALLASLCGAGAWAQQQPLRVAPIALSASVEARDTADRESALRGSGLSTVLVQTAPANPVLPSGLVSYEMRISNLGNFTVTSASVVLTANGALTLQSVDPALSCNGGTFPVSCALTGGVPIGTNSRILSFTAQMPAASAINPPTQSFILGAIATGGGTGDTGGSTTTTVTVERDFSIGGVATPGSVQVGQPFAYGLTVSNAGPFLGDWSGVQVTVDLPDQVRYRPDGNSGPFSCSGSTAPGALLTCAYSGPADGGSSQAFTVGAEAVSTATNAIATLSVAAPVDPNPSNNFGSVGVSIAPTVAQVVFTKTTLTPSPANPTLPVDFQLDVTASTSNNVSLSGLQLTDALPTGLVFSGVQSGSPAWSCTGSAQSVSCQLTQNLAPGASAPALVLRTTPQSGVGGQTLTNQATLSSQQLAPISAQSTVSFGPDLPQLSLLKTAPAVVNTDAEFVYGLQVQNSGQFPASGLVLRDPLPAGVVFLSAQGAACTLQGDAVVCPLSLPAGASQAINLSVRAPSVPGFLSNTARLEFGEGSFIESTAQTTVTNAPRPDVTVSKSVDLPVVAPGGRLNYTVTVTNIGGSEALGVELVDTLPVGVTLRSVTPAGCTGEAVIRCNVGVLAPGAQQSYLIAVDVAASASGTLTNVARVSASLDDNPANNEGTATSSVQQQAAPMADLSMSAQVTPATYPGSDAELLFRASLRNLGPDTAQGVQVAIQLPATGLSVQSAQFGGQTCAVSAGGGSCLIGALPNGAEIQGELRVRLTAALPQVLARFSASAQTMDPVVPNNTAEAAANLLVPPPLSADLALTLNGPAQARLGDQLSLSATIANNGPESASNVRLSSSLPPALRLISAAGQASCTQTGQELRCDLAGSLLAREQRTLVLTLATQNVIGPVSASFAVSGNPADPVPANNTASYALSIGTPTDDQAIEQLLSDITDVFARDAIPTVADICANPPADLAAQCEAIIRARLNGDIAGATRGLRALFPEEVLSQALSANQLAATQFTNVDARISELRGGAGGFSISGLTVQVGRQAIPLSIFKGFGQSEDEPAIGGAGDLISPWGAFVNGTISFGDQTIDAQQRNTVADFDSYALTAGVDYRRSARLVFGGALGWNKFQSNLTDEGRLDTKGWTLTGYGSWYPLERLYLDGRLSYGRLDFAMQRRILIPGVVDRLAQGNTDGSQLALALATGYHFNQAGWSITPNASWRYVDTTYDPFSETGAGANNASFGENKGKSVQLSFGVSVSRAFSLSNGVLLPQFDISMNREMRNQNLLVEAELLGAPGNVFRVRSDDVDRTFGNVGLGFVFVMANGRQFYVSYRELFGLDGLSRGSVNLGGRFEF